MSPTTAEYWDVEGQNLNNLAFNIETLGGRWRSNKLRGENLPVPNRPGRVWVPKVPDEKELVLAMWVQGATEAGTIPTGTAELAQFNDNWRNLLKAFSIRSRLFSVTKRWYEVAGAPVLKSATALCELNGVMDLSMLGRGAAKFVVSLNLPDPYFYGAAVVSNITPIGQAIAVLNAGDDLANDITIRFNGPLTNPTLQNATASPAVWVKWTGALATGQWVELVVKEFTAKKHDGSNVVGGVTHNGAKAWMEMYVGNNSLMLTTDSGTDTGNAVVTHKPAYL